MHAIYKNIKHRPASLNRPNLSKTNLQENSKNHKIKYINEMNLSTFEKQKQRATWLRQHKLINSTAQEKVLQDASLYLDQQRTAVHPR